MNDNLKTCKHCDVTFKRPDSIDIPSNACTRCYEEIMALEKHRLVGWHHYFFIILSVTTLLMLIIVAFLDIAR